MDYILSIHTATETAIAALSLGSEVVASVENTGAKNHASFLHPAIGQMMLNNKLNFNQLSAIAVTNGPGSYTGIRVGMAAAKGLCFATGIPLITINTLEVMAYSAIIAQPNAESLYGPMIDARRMEVFTAVYDIQLKEIISPSAVILTEPGFLNAVSDKKIFFFGNGSEKFKPLASGNACFLNQEISANALAGMAFEKYQKKQFNSAAYAEPLYLKEFQSTSIPSK
jgi:tRNA threonylcarbamoyladenosine biosynthesis protein TsaB